MLKYLILFFIVVPCFSQEIKSPVDSILDAERYVFSQYYHIAKIKNPELKGLVVFKLRIEKGKLEKIWILAETTYHSKLLNKIVRRLQRVDYAGADTTLRYRIIFD